MVKTDIEDLRTLWTSNDNVLKKIKFSTNCVGCYFYDDWNGFCKYKSNFVPDTGCSVKYDLVGEYN